MVELRTLIPRILAGVTACIVGAIPSCQNCTEQLNSGISVYLVDETTRQPICNAEVTLTDGTYTETLPTDTTSPCGYSGAWERAGTYRVTISHPDYLPRMIDGVRVTEDDCDHVNSQVLKLELTAGKPECFPGDMASCTCPSGAMGTKSCGPDGKLTACQGC
jgi:hypothetical protein